MSKNIQIISIDAATSLGLGAESTWERMMAKVHGIKPMKSFPHNKYQTNVAAEISNKIIGEISVEIDIESNSRALLLALSTARRALRNLSCEWDKKELRTGLVLSTTKGDMQEFERRAMGKKEREEFLFIPYNLAQKLAAVLEVGGPVFAVSSACTSGLVAVIQAARVLDRGDADMMLVIGVDILSDFILQGFSSLSLLSTEPCRPYDKSRDGLSLGEGAGAILLARERFASASAMGVLKGWGVTNDAEHITGPSRTGKGLAFAIQNSLEMAKINCEKIHYINGNGTGTIPNDQMEALALEKLFRGKCPPVSSMKGYFGHTLGAAGVIEAALSVVALNKSVIPASLGFEELGVEGNLNVSGDHIPVQEMDNILVIKSGFGGVNASAVISRAV
jgi:3-oxoacyl-[acyl-carrier-protein] synthase-1